MSAVVAVRVKKSIKRGHKTQRTRYYLEVCKGIFVGKQGELTADPLQRKEFHERNKVLTFLKKYPGYCIKGIRRPEEKTRTKNRKVERKLKEVVQTEEPVEQE